MVSLLKPCRRSCASFVVWTLCLAASTDFASAFVPSKPVAFSPKASVRPASSLCAQRRGRPKGPLRTIEVKPTMNGEIQHAELRVVTPTPKGKDEALGIMSKEEALAKAKDMGDLDVILINENTDPPICKIVDYSKYRYMKEKKAKELKKNSKATEVKEVKMSYKIDVHDYGVRKKNASKFLNQGNRVKITIMFRGREVQHDKLGFELIDKLAQDLENICTKEGKPVREGRNLSVILGPRPEVVKAVSEGRRAIEKKKRREREASLKQKQAATAAAAAAGTVAAAQLDEENDLIALNNAALESSKVEDIEDDEELESSLDDLLGSDDIKDDLFA